MPHPSRRQFLRHSASCAAHVALAASVLPRALRADWTRSIAGPIVAQEKFGRLERIAEGVWALVSTPLTGDMTTVANGGLIAGRSGVLAVEGFMQPGGAQWLAEQAVTLTGRRPTHVALTHYPADHVDGLAGYGAGGSAPNVLSTVATRDLALERNHPEDVDRSAALRTATPLEAGALAYGANVSGFFIATNPGRPVTLNMNGESESTFGGGLGRLTGTAAARVGKHLGVTVDLTRSWVSLPNGAFTADLIATRIGVAVTTRLFVNTLVQYNTLDRRVASNVRFQYIFRPGSDLYLVFNEERGSLASMSTLQARGTRLNGDVPAPAVALR